MATRFESKSSSSCITSRWRATRETRAPQRRRWAAGRELVRMSTERHRSLKAWRQRHGAGSVRIARAAAACAVESRLRFSSSTTSGCIARSAAVGVASFGARLRSSSRRKVRAASCFAVQRCVAVRSVSSGLRPAHLLRPASLPNNSLEPTLETTAALLRVGVGAAQLNRWA
jgi:hypothetical protein